MGTRTGFLIWWIFLAIFASCSKPSGSDKEDTEPDPVDNRSLREQYSLATADWPKAEWYEGVITKELAALPANPFSDSSPKLIELGKALFFDNRLGNGGNSCASCHNPDVYWIDQKKVATGIGTHHRNTPTMENVWYLDGHLFHDGRAKTYAEQIAEAIESPIEMGGNLAVLPWALSQIEGYIQMFTEAYGNSEINRDKILLAIEMYSKSISSRETAFDRFVKGDHDALSDLQIEGLHLFRTKGKCINCHNGPFFTDLQYHNLGYATDYEGKLDNGRYEATGLESDKGKFRTPGLRNVLYTAPYWHNGEIATLAEVVDLINRGMPHSGRQRVNGTLSTYARPLELSRHEQQAIIIFLSSLSSDRPKVERPILPK